MTDFPVTSAASCNLFIWKKQQQQKKTIQFVIGLCVKCQNVLSRRCASAATDWRAGFCVSSCLASVAGWFPAVQHFDL